MDITVDLQPEFMSIEELAQRMGIGLTTAYALAKRNELPVPVIRIGRAYRFSRRAYDALATAQHTGAGTDAAWTKDSRYGNEPYRVGT